MSAGDFDLVGADVLEYVLLPLLPMDALLAVRLSCVRLERLARVALAACPEMPLPALLSLGHVQQLRRCDPRAALRFFAAAAGQSASEMARVPRRDGALLRTRTMAYHVLSDMWGTGLARAYTTGGFWHVFARYRMATCLSELGDPAAAVSVAASVAEENVGEGLNNALFCCLGLQCRTLSEQRGCDAALLRRARDYYRQASWAARGLAGYNLACCAALRGRPGKALKLLREAVGTPGCPGRETALRDAHLACIRAGMEALEWPESIEEQKEENVDDWGQAAYTRDMMTEETELQRLAREQPTARAAM
jgi:hypothetical protein